MSYLQSGFNLFLERSFVSDPQASTLAALPINYFRNMALDQLQVSGTMGNVFQMGGSSGSVDFNDSVGLNDVANTFLNGAPGGINNGLAGGALSNSSVSNSQVSGGDARDMTLSGNLKLGGKIIVGNSNIVIDGNQIRITLTDDSGNDIIILGKDAGAF